MSGAAGRAARALLVLAVVAVGVASLLPQGAGPAAPGGDKLHHALAYCALGLLGVTAFRAARLRVLGALLAYGALIELAQGTLTRTRTAEWADLAADAAGLAVAWSLAWLAVRLRPSRPDGPR